MSGHDLPQGRGRGEHSKLSQLEEGRGGRLVPKAQPSGSGLPVVDIDAASDGSGSGSGSGERTIRGRGGFRNELRTKPEHMGDGPSRAPDSAEGTMAKIMGNFVRVDAMRSERVYQYRVDFEPSIESTSMRTRLLKMAIRNDLPNYVFDGASEIRSPNNFADGSKLKSFIVALPEKPDDQISLRIKLTGEANWAPAEVLRVYNINMNQIMRILGYQKVSATGGFVHPSTALPIGNTGLVMMRGYNTSVQVHEQRHLYCNLESVHKILQSNNVFEHMKRIRQTNPGNFKESIQQQYIGKLVMTKYNNKIYRVDDIDFALSPKSKFFDKKNGREVTYIEYFKDRYGVDVKIPEQPLLCVSPSTQRRGERDEERVINVIPELCNMAGLTEEQRNDNRLKMDLIRSSQIPPQERVNQCRQFLNSLHSNDQIKEILQRWEYKMATDLVKIKGRLLPIEKVAFATARDEPSARWPKVDYMASFEQTLMKEKLAVAPTFKKMVVVISRREANNKDRILGLIKDGFQRVGLNLGAAPNIMTMEGDSANHYAQQVRSIPKETDLALIIMAFQNKEKYDTIKRICAIENGLLSQVVTSKLMLDDRKARGAAVKIAIQIAAKIGGEPWLINLPLKGSMICGYDTYHDTSQRGRSFGAFVASMNQTYSKWFSKTDRHSAKEELSTNLANNMAEALTRYYQKEKRFPTRVILYRDGVGDGDLDHVFNVELQQVRRALRHAKDSQGGDVDAIKLCFVIVNKRLGARFFMAQGDQFVNPSPGTIIDDVVTRQERYDFYLVSQSTRQGTVSPTYYNVIHDDTGLPIERLQMMTYKLCLGYYNWAGTVRVPAPCQYAHKLALLCGEHLHNSPNVSLNNYLHYL